MDVFGDIDLDVLRGWAETRDPELRAEHALPPLCRLVRADGAQVETIHGPDVLVGRYHPQYGPVDVILRGLADHQNYRLGAPHLHLSLGDDGGWTVRNVSPTVETSVAGVALASPETVQPIESGDDLTLGCVSYRFEASGLTLGEWEDARARLLDEADCAGLYLCRRGGPCGPCRPLEAAGELTVGRSFPAVGTLPDGHRWGDPAPPDWDLAGLYEEERKFVAFEHARLEQRDADWYVVPRAARRKTFVNRLEIIDATPVSFGDEIALGSVIFYLHKPSAGARPARKAIEPPAVVDWQEGSTPILDETSDAQDEGAI